MFFWKKKPTEAEKVAQARNEASMKALTAGDIPLNARERLEKHFTNNKDFFSSDFSCREFTFVREAGYEPISQVMGCSFMNISLLGGQRQRSSTGELHDVTKALSDARKLAVSRLQKEAELLNATGVIGIRLVVKKQSWDTRMVEFTAIGTAIRVPGREQKVPFTSALTAQEFWQLQQAGYWPVHLTLGLCSYYVWTDPETRRTLYSWWGTNNRNNAEVRAYTQGFYTAREHALARISLDLQDHKAEGAVGMKIDEEVQSIEYEINDRRYHDFIFNFCMMGTSIRKDDSLLARKPNTSTLVIYDLAKGKNVNVEINNVSYNGDFDED